MPSFDEICIIIGAKEIELFETRKQLDKTRKLLARLTSGEGDAEEGRDEGATEQAEG